ncbi:class I SAM-dependent methyltransferase [Christensenellaceae bacterium OttesenSCG-928-K19]|nr:class I SAM-dependent methyltransferase [Christensenellaceae bacterium OttesenSCG-928-K19]
MEESRVKKHFEEEAREYDDIILRLIPNYRQMVDVLVSLLHYEESQDFHVIDLGCGTGTISKAVKDKFSNIHLTCVDIAENMLDIASVKNGSATKLIQADFNTFVFPEKYDVVVSSLALHHLETESDKLKFYKAIFDAMNPGGIFINIDVVQSDDPELQEIYLQKWKDYMLTNTSQAEVEGKWLPNYYAEDRPISLIKHLDMLREVGFSVVDVAYKYYNYAVYTAKK